MNQNIQASIDYLATSLQDHIDAQSKYIAWLRDTCAGIEGSDRISPFLSGCLPWFTVTNREDLQELLKLSPSWSKATERSTMKYTAKVGDYEIIINATNSALPPTCKVIQERKIIPAQPEREVIEERIVCEARTVLL